MPNTACKALASGASAAAKAPKPQTSDAAGETAGTTNALTPEEQMALYEKQLKEDDWGHQPC